MKQRKLLIALGLAMILGGCGQTLDKDKIQVTDSVAVEQQVEDLEEKQELKQIQEQEETKIITKVSTESEATSLVLEYIKDHDEYLPAYINIESETDEAYIVHAYDLKINPATRQKYVCTIAKYEVNKETGEITKQ